MRKILGLTMMMVSEVAQAASTHEFQDLVVFGDSLSDMGNIERSTPRGKTVSKMVAGSETPYADLLSRTFTGHPLVPSRLGGTDYAVSNTTTFPTSRNPYPYLPGSTQEQIALYLETQTVSPHNLYIIWSGGNDLAAIVLDPVLMIQDEGVPINSRNHFAGPAVIAEKVRALHEAGAGPVWVANLPDFSLGPRVLTGVPGLIESSTFTSPAWLREPLWQLCDRFSRWFYAPLRQQGAHLPSPGEGGVEYIHRQQKEFYPFWNPVGWMAIAIAHHTSFLIQNFNYFLHEKLKKVGGNIVYFDIYHLFNEVVEDPNSYGFTDILLPTCKLTGYAWDIDCQQKQKEVYHAENTYLWSDMVHPSPVLHRLFSQYMTSIFNAPLVPAMLFRQNARAFDDSEAVILSNVVDVTPKSLAGRTLYGVKVSGGIDRYTTQSVHSSQILTLNLSAQKGINKTWIVGSLLSLGLGRVHSLNQYAFNYSSILLSLYGKYILTSHGWLLIGVEAGRGESNNIRRIIALGSAKREETGQTYGYSLGIQSKLGYDFEMRGNFIMTPYFGFSWRHYFLHGFDERTNRSTAMRFGDSRYNEKQGQWGLRLVKKLENGKIYTGLEQIYPIHNSVIIPAGVKSSTLSFKRQISVEDHSTTELYIGFSKKINHQFSINGSGSYRLGQNKERKITANLGVQWSFS